MCALLCYLIKCLAIQKSIKFIPQFGCHILILDKSPYIMLRLHTSRACNTAFTTTANFILLPQF